MARQPGTIDPDEVKRQLGSFFERAVEAIGEVKDAVVRTSQVGKIKLDATFLRRERDRLFQKLGEDVFDLAEDGKLTLPEELEPLFEQLRELERKLSEQEQEIAAVKAEATERREAEQDEAVAAREVEEGGAEDDDDGGELSDDEDDVDSEPVAVPVKKVKGSAKKTVGRRKVTGDDDDL